MSMEYLDTHNLVAYHRARILCTYSGDGGKRAVQLRGLIPGAGKGTTTGTIFGHSGIAIDQFSDNVIEANKGRGSKPMGTTHRNREVAYCRRRFRSGLGRQMPCKQNPTNIVVLPHNHSPVLWDELSVELITRHDQGQKDSFRSPGGVLSPGVSHNDMLSLDITVANVGPYLMEQLERHIFRRTIIMIKE